MILSSCRLAQVQKGQVYRSPQPKGNDLQRAIDELGIKTIINLRGENSGEDWYDDEKRVADENSVELINISMSASRLPHRKDLIKLLDAFKTAPRPILIHCLAGVDRTGEASALYQMIYMNYSKKDALHMLSPAYGHFEKFKPAKRYFIKEVWQGEEWARTSYDPCKTKYEYYDQNNSICHPETDKDSFINLDSKTDEDT